MEWKKLTCPGVTDWEVKLPGTFSGEKWVSFRCPDRDIDLSKFFDFLRDVYGITYNNSHRKEIIKQKKDGAEKVCVKLPLLEGKNLKLITEDFAARDWKFIRTCRTTEYKTFEEELIKDIVIKLLDNSLTNLSVSGNLLLEYKEMLKFANLIKFSTGRLDKATFEAHRKFLKDGLNKKLKFPKDTLIKWIQSVVGTEIDGRYGLETWLLVKKNTIGENKRFLAPVAEMSAKKLREIFIPYKTLGSKAREITSLMFEEVELRAQADKIVGERSPDKWDLAGSLRIAADRYRTEWDKLLKKQLQEEIVQFNEFVNANREKRDEIERRAREMYKRIFDNLGWYSSEKLVGKTLTEITKALGPQTPEDLILDILLQVIAVGVTVYIGKTIIQARRIERAKRMAALLDDLKLSTKSKKIILLQAEGFSRNAAFAATKYAAQRRQWISTLPRKTRKAAEKAANMAKKWSDDILRKYPKQGRIAHHLLPEGGKEAKFFRLKFKKIFGKDIIDSWQIPLPERFHPGTVHRGTGMNVGGGWWNAQWKKFFAQPESELTPEKVFKYLEKLIKEVSAQ